MKIRSMPVVFRELSAIRSRQAPTALIQRQRKDGSWGKARAERRFGGESDHDVAQRLNNLNPGQSFRVAE